MAANFQSPSSESPDVIIVGAGVIGLSLALELHSRGAQVVVLERDTALSHASSAAAGMLAAEDPHNPPLLLPLSHWSLELYPAYLARIEATSGIAVPCQTFVTWQHGQGGTAAQLAEHSLDPRQLAVALLATVRATSIKLREHTEVVFAHEDNRGVIVETSDHQRLHAAQLVYAAGAWTSTPAAATEIPLPVRPVKGQMLRVRPSSIDFPREARRNGEVYVLPRTHGPQAGTVILGATVEDAGFDCTVGSRQLSQLRERAAALHPSLAFARNAEQVEAWAGLRPATPDGLPLLGSVSPRQSVASGHYRNGILLAPATAIAIADQLEGREARVDLAAFSPQRFELIGASKVADNRTGTDDNAFAHLR